MIAKRKDGEPVDRTKNPDEYYTNEVRQRVHDQVSKSGILLEHWDMVENSIAETLSHLSVENTEARLELLAMRPYVDDTEIQRLLGKLNDYMANPWDKLTLIAAQLKPSVGSLELGRQHHFLNYRDKAERAMYDEVTAGVERFGMSLNDEPELHKIKVQDVAQDPQTGEVTGFIISIKETMASLDNILVRQRRKLYVDKRDVLMYERNGYSGSIAAQQTQLQRALSKNKGSTIDINSFTAKNLLNYANEHPEHLLTSIYYGFVEGGANSPMTEYNRYLGTTALASVR